MHSTAEWMTAPARWAFVHSNTVLYKHKPRRMNCAYSIRLQHDDAIAVNTNNFRTTKNSGNRLEAWDQLSSDS